MRLDSTLLASGVGNGMTEHVLRRLRGGMSNLDIPDRSQCCVQCHEVLARKETLLLV